MKPLIAVVPSLLIVTACGAQTPQPERIAAPVPKPSQTPAGTIIKDRAAFQRLIGNSGLTLQWISWNERGDLSVDYSTDLLRLTGSQSVPPNRGRLSLDGVVTQIGTDSFTFVGRIDIVDTPDAGRNCHREGEMTFRITQNRQYWRLQQMEACDGLTDYVDIYF